MKSMAHAAQFDLITDDPRIEVQKGVLAELVSFVEASKEHRGLLTMSQAAKILGVPSGQVSTWTSRGRISSMEVLGVKMVSASEVLALYKERKAEVKSKGGAGLKAPSLAEIAGAAWDDFESAIR